MISVFLNWLTDCANAFIDVVNRGESASAVNYSSRGQAYRVPQIVDSLQTNPLRYADKTLPFITSLDLHVHLHDTKEQVISLLNEFAGQRGKKNLVIILMNADLLLTERFDLLPIFNTFALSQEQCSIIYFFKKNITAPSYVKKLSHFSSLYHNIFIKRPYTTEEVRSFIQELAKEYNFSLDKALQELIITQCGDRLWLVREALRHLAKTNDRSTLFTHDGMILRLNTIMTELEEWEHDVLRKLVREEMHFTPEEKQTITYLVNTGFLVPHGDSFTIRVALLRDYVKTYYADATTINVTNKKDIVINNTIVTSTFSPSERRMLRHFLQNKGKIVTRDEIAQAVWKEESQEKYSDWAIDQLVRRVRQKLMKLGLPEDTIATKKNQGYVIED